MGFTLELAPEASADINALPIDLQERVYDHLDALAAANDFAQLAAALGRNVPPDEEIISDLVTDSANQRVYVFLTVRFQPSLRVLYVRQILTHWVRTA